jgi:hypothetical protein
VSLPPNGMKVDLWSLSVTRDEIESREITLALLELAPLLTTSNVKRFRRKVTLTIDGYGDDPRDLYAIDEMREWARLLDIGFPSGCTSPPWVMSPSSAGGRSACAPGGRCRAAN